jgi:hypothetical protein
LVRVSAERKIRDEDLARLRHLHDDEGWVPGDLAQAFGITPQHVGRLLRGEQRPTMVTQASGSVLADLEAFLAEVELDAGDQVLAAAARSLAAKMDACQASDSASAAQAMPRLNGQLVDTLDRLRGNVPPEPDLLDRLRSRREPRLNGINGNGRTNHRPMEG